MEKRCKTCGEVKDVSEYYMSRGNPLSNCKECHKVITRARSMERYHSDPLFRERVLDNARRWSMEHRDIVSKKHKKYRNQ